VRAQRVNGVLVGDRPQCQEGRHEFAAHHGYCLHCGQDGWPPEQRRETEKLQREVEYPRRPRARSR
jgi:hypothetical protein